MERSMAFYIEVFGFRLLQRFSLGDEDVAFLEAGAARLELIASRPATERTTQPAAVDHVALHVRDLGAWVRRLRQHGVPLLDESPVSVEELGASYVFCVGPDGERIELFSVDAPPAVQ
jgi:catechol 2,3-dioxygenase-like lactoylglutathione lyase family enzyme